MWAHMVAQKLTDKGRCTWVDVNEVHIQTSLTDGNVKTCCLLAG